MKSTPPRRVIRFGPDRLAAGDDRPRHQHAEPYATLVLKGAYEQLAYAGRLRLECGDVLIQPTFDCHANRMLSRGVELIRLPWRHEASLGGVYRGCRIDLIRQIAAHDIVEAVALLEEELTSRTPQRGPIEDCEDELASGLAATSRLRIGQWAQRAHLSRESVSRGFSSVYGVPPVQFRAELSARAAWLRVIGSCDPLSRIATELGFADQAHMTRAIRALTGAPPSGWRRSHLFKTLSSGSIKLAR